MSPSRTLIGFGFVVVGLLLLMQNAGWLDAGDVIADWWPVLLVAVGLIQLNGDRDNWLGPVILIVVGFVLLGIRHGVVGRDIWSFVWPFALIALGLWIVAGRGDGTNRLTEPDTHAVAALSSRDVVVEADTFSSGDVTVLLGAMTLDLTKTTPAAGAVVTATVVLGSLDVLIPEGWRATFTGTPLLAGWDDTTRRDGLPEDAPTVEVKAFAVLAGIEVRHPNRWG